MYSYVYNLYLEESLKDLRVYSREGYKQLKRKIQVAKHVLKKDYVLKIINII